MLSAGTRLGPYEILAPLGAGGMGEVYRARDTRLNREVAIKMLPEAFAADPDRMARFAREAQVLASLNHPNIATIYGIEDSGQVHALVMELVDGCTLEERIAGRPMPLDEILPIARQIAEGLDYAHEKGIVHRDLKPANVKLSPDGVVKILDFGLAKALEPARPTSDPTNSPTLTLDGTLAGVILGTAAYMAPEQARGSVVDKRADIWAFGVVLFEMLSGRPAFGGETISDILAAVLRAEPDWAALPASTPASIRELLRRCLERDRKLRLRDIGDARLTAGEPPPDHRTRPHQALPWMIAGTLAVALILLAAMSWRTPRSEERPLVRLSVDVGPDPLVRGGGPPVVISRDGKRLVVCSRGPNGVTRLSTRLLDQAQATPLPGTEDAINPFFSPDGQWIGFFAEHKLKKISVQGGAPITLCYASSPRGASWGEDGNIAFAANITGGLLLVPSSGGMPKALTELKPGESSHRWPQVLPGGKAVLFAANDNSFHYDEGNIEIQSLSTRQRKTLHRRGSFGRYLPSGHLVYSYGGTLFAAPMDLTRLELTGPAAPSEQVAVSSYGSALFDFSHTGAFLALSGSGMDPTSIMWLDSSGSTERFCPSPREYVTPRLSPDGQRIAFALRERGNWNIYMYDQRRDSVAQVTSGSIGKLSPLWSRTGRHLIFYMNASERRKAGLFWIPSDRAAEPQQLTESNNMQTPESLSSDGKWLAFSERDGTGRRLWILELAGSESDSPKAGKPVALRHSAQEEVGADFSPDGRWLAYASDESGTLQVYVRPFSGAAESRGDPWPISTGGGKFPMWSRNGRELFYESLDNRIMVVEYTVSGDRLSAGKPRLWSDRQIMQATSLSTSRNLDLSPDGKRFAVLQPPPKEKGEEKSSTQVTFLLNFFDELRRRVPSSK